MQKLAGQWLGLHEGEVQGTFMVDLDLTGGRLKGTGYFFATGNLSLSENFDYTYQELRSGVIVRLIPFNPQTGYIISQEETASFYPDIEGDLTAHITLRMEGIKLQLTWKTSLGTQGRTVLTKHSNFPDDSIHPIGDINSWDGFVEWLEDTSKKNAHLFRGQHEGWPLITSFHRTRRTDLRTYRETDIQLLHRALTASTRHYFNIKDPDELGAFLNLAQHHGFPTPLLDWTESPFIAAFFAFSKKKNKTPARIYVLDRDALLRSQGRFYITLTHTHPHFSIIEPLLLENSRALPQQALLALTNLKNVGAYLRFLEAAHNLKIVHAINLPAAEGTKVLRQLRLMGITEASLFPGLDGICGEMRARLYD